MAAMTNYLENKLIDFFFRRTALGVAGSSAAANSGPATLYFGLFTSATVVTDLAGSGTEVSAASYERVAVTCGASAFSATDGLTSTIAASAGTSGTTANIAPITFPSPGATGWGLIRYFGIFDTATKGTGNVLFYGQLAEDKTINANDAAPAFQASAFTLRIDD
jgi:hypothetical protein